VLLERTPVRLAYLLSQYPAVNHVFMLREIRQLRKLGFEIHVASIRGLDRPLEALTEVEREEARSTYYIKSASLREVARAHALTLASRPLGYLRGFCGALRGAGLSPRKLVSRLFYFAEAVVVGQWMKRNRLRHVHTHFSSGVALIVARTFPVTMSATFHGPAEFEDTAGFRLAEKIGASLFSCAISYYGLSRLMYATAPSQWPKLEVTPLGVDAAEFSPRPFRENSPVFEILSVGRLAPVKGQQAMIAAVDTVVKEGRRIRLRLAGDGPDRAELEREVERRGLSQEVIFEGNLNQDQLRAVYRESDAFVLSSFGEGLPVALMEAMAMEIPCIATWIAGIPELIRDGVGGLLVAPGDVQSLAKAIIRLMSDAELQRRLGQSGRRRILEGYEVITNVGRFGKVLSRRLAEAAAASERSHANP
jgi:glycosyltransferase involved in cell wall biosynthesis